MPETREVLPEIERFVAARPAGGDALTEAIVAARLFGPTRAPVAKLGRFTLLERVGQGATGDVLAAYDPLLDRKVALKLLRTDARLDADRREWLLREARAAARLSHPNVVSIHEVGELDGDAGIYVAMEYVDGTTLRRWSSERRDPGAIVQVFVGAGLGLAAAHAAGIIHRDFKPENVLVVARPGARPLAKVVDFGLAGVVERHAESPDQDHDQGAAGIRREFSTIAGTPAYMAPEQLRGQALDVRADQFGFCVALAEALCGRHPYLRSAGDESLEPERIVARIAALGRTGLERGIPARLRRVLERGMAVDPAARYRTMDELVAALRSRPRRRWALLGVLAGLASTLALTLSLRVDAPAVTISCSAADELRGIWDADVRARTRDAFASSGSSDAEALWQWFEPRVDDHAGAWLAARERGCVTGLRGGVTLSPALAQLRERCLDRRRAELEGLAELATRPEREAVSAALVAVAQLTPLSSCEDLDSLQREASLSDGFARPEVDALRSEIAARTTQARAGFERELGPAADQLLARAQELHAGVAIAEASVLVSLVADARGDYVESARMLERAVLEAIALRHDRLHADAATRLIWIVGVRLRDSEQTAKWVAHADAAIRATRDDPLLRGRWADHRGALASLERDFSASEQLHRQAIARFEQAVPAAWRELNFSRHNLGLTLLMQAKHGEAEALLSESLAAMRARLGPRHPDVAKMLGNLGQAYHEAGDARGVVLLEESLALQEDLFGREHIALTAVINSLAVAYAGLGRSGEAQVLLRRAIAIVERNDGPQAERLEWLLHNLAFEEWLAGQSRAAIGHAERALAIQTTRYGPNHTTLALTLELIARAWLDLGERERALTAITEALARLEGGGQLTARERGNVLLSAAIIERAAGRPRARIEALAEAARPLLADDAAALEELDVLLRAK